MQLENYIKDLLHRYDCVIIPNFGAFLTQRVSAKIHKSTHTFYPPKKIISFNEQLQNNDGLLINYIAEVKKTPYDDAAQNVASYIKSMKSYLIEGETIRLENIGELILNAEGKIVFSPSFHINYLTDAFGLSHYTLNSINREICKEVITTPVVALTSEKRSNTNWLKYAAAVVILFGLSGSYIGTKYYSDSIKNHNKLAVEEFDSQLNTEIQEATFVINNPLPAITLALKKQNSGNYHIVGGAFRIEANANKKVRQLKAKGFNARKIEKNKYGLHVVVYGSFSNRSDANRELQLIRRDYNPSAWLYIKALD